MWQITLFMVGQSRTHILHSLPKQMLGMTLTTHIDTVGVCGSMCAPLHLNFQASFLLGESPQFQNKCGCRTHHYNCSTVFLILFKDTLDRVLVGRMYDFGMCAHHGINWRWKHTKNRKMTFLQCSQSFLPTNADHCAHDISVPGGRALGLSNKKNRLKKA